MGGKLACLHTCLLARCPSARERKNAPSMRLHAAVDIPNRDTRGKNNCIEIHKSPLLVTTASKIKQPTTCIHRTTSTSNPSSDSQQKKGQGKHWYWYAQHHETQRENFRQNQSGNDRKGKENCCLARSRSPPLPHNKKYEFQGQGSSLSFVPVEQRREGAPAAPPPHLQGGGANRRPAEVPITEKRL